MHCGSHAESLCTSCAFFAHLGMRHTHSVAYTHESAAAFFELSRCQLHVLDEFQYVILEQGNLFCR